MSNERKLVRNLYCLIGVHFVQSFKESVRNKQSSIPKRRLSMDKILFAAHSCLDLFAGAL